MTLPAISQENALAGTRAHSPTPSSPQHASMGKRNTITFIFWREALNPNRLYELYCRLSKIDDVSTDGGVPNFLEAHFASFLICGVISIFIF